MSAEQQAYLVNDAKELESHNQILMAYRQYDIAANANGPNTEYRLLAGKKSAELSTLIGEACRPVYEGLKEHFSTYGVFPDNLEIFRSKIPEHSLLVFNEFKLVDMSDGTKNVDCGYYGHIHEPPK